MRIDDVAEMDARKTAAVGFAGDRIDRRRAGAAVASAEIVDADYKKPVGIDDFIRAEVIAPPAGLTFRVPSFTGAGYLGIETSGVL